MQDKMACNYEMLEAVASKFAQQSEAIEMMTQKIRTHVQACEGEWIGRGHSAFFSKMNDEVLPSCAKLQQVLLDTSSVTKQMSQAMADAEQEASAAFQVSA
ncbi:MAG: WXG100 family type VII secretion target [Candidatus Promineifilaceae bacterium]